MKAGKTLSGIVLFTISLPFFALATPGPVRDDNSGYWSSGLLVGRRGPVTIRGFAFFPYRDMNFLLGNKQDAGDRHFIPETIRVATFETEEFRKLHKLPSDQTVVLNYVHPLPMNPLYWGQAKYYVEVVGAGYDFKETSSHRRFGYNFQEHPPYSGHQGKINQRGTIIHVSRWGTSCLGKVCTVWLQESGNKGAMSTPHVSRMNIYSEDGCVYAEDVARSMAQVFVGYTRGAFDPWNNSVLTIHSINVKEPEGSASGHLDMGSHTTNTKAQKRRAESQIGDPCQVQNIHEGADTKISHKAGLNPPWSKKGL